MGKNDKIDPWGEGLPEDYKRIIEKFGLEKFNPKDFPEPNILMRRGIIFAGRDLKKISDAINHRKPYYVLTGIMPSAEKIHFGTKNIIDMVSYFQQHGAETYVCIADLESLATRKVSLEEAKKRALNFHIPLYLALGLDIKKTKFYFQSENKEVMHLAYDFSNRLTLNEYRAVYGNAEPSRIISSLTQMGDILFPQMDKPMPGIIPVGVDQDPHIRVTRDIVARYKKKRFITPSSIYSKFMPSLNGSIKMSKSSREGSIFLPSQGKDICKLIKKALTGGRESIEAQKKYGGNPEKCMIFELYKEHLIKDDNELEEIRQKCKRGDLLCGQCKRHACELMNLILGDINEKFEKMKTKMDKVKFITFND